MSRARHSDPSSSHAAAAVVARGIAGHQQRQAAAAVRACPGLTSAELSIETGLDRYMLARRLPELLAVGEVTRKGPRPDRNTGRPGVTWWPEDESHDAG